MSSIQNSKRNSRSPQKELEFCTQEGFTEMWLKMYGQTMVELIEGNFK
jgi:hypothetical protein